MALYPAARHDETCAICHTACAIFREVKQRLVTADRCDSSVCATSEEDQVAVHLADPDGAR